MLVYILFGLFVRVLGAIDDENIVNELACKLSGGECMKASNCPLPSNLLHSFCPAQAKDGVVCCHGISYAKKSCRERAGECMQGCPNRYIEKNAEGCEDNETCCVNENDFAISCKCTVPAGLQVGTDGIAVKLTINHKKVNYYIDISRITV